MLGYHEHKDNAQGVNKKGGQDRGGGQRCSTKEKKEGNDDMDLKMGQRRKEVRRENVR